MVITAQARTVIPTSAGDILDFVGESDGSAIALAVLQDPMRGRLYAFVRRQRQPVTREQAAAALGISRKLAAFHLDKLVTAGLLSAGNAEAGRRGPGRTPKAYAPTRGEWDLSVPPRSYPLLAEVLTAALAEMGSAGQAAAGRAAADTGRRLGQQVRADRRLGRLGPERALSMTAEVLEDAGYEPDRQACAITLGNCPFAKLAARDPALVCRLNRDLIGGLLDGLGASPPLRAALLPAPSRCCVEVCTSGPASPPRQGTNAA